MYSRYELDCLLRESKHTKLTCAYYNDEDGVAAAQKEIERLESLKKEADYDAKNREALRRMVDSCSPAELQRLSQMRSDRYWETPREITR
jgi:hypothetical protein